jgi:hypothetical protein
MTERTSHLDPDERLRSLNPVPDQPPEAEIDAALRRLLMRVPTAEASSRTAWLQGTTRRRTSIAGGVAATAAVAAFVVINVLPASRTPGAVSDAFAKQVIAHTAAAVAGTGTGVLHVVETVTNDEIGAAGPTSSMSTVQSWEEQTAPYAYWVTDQYGSDAITTTLSDDTVEHYESASNTLIEWRNTPPLLEFEQFETDPAYRAAFSLAHSQDLAAAIKLAGAKSSSSQPPETFSDLIVALLNAPGVTVNPNASVNGESAISITGSNGAVTLYVQPGTYTPLQFVVTRGSGRAQQTITATFSTYETLPTGSVSMPNLAQLHPSAKVWTTTFRRSH